MVGIKIWAKLNLEAKMLKILSEEKLGLVFIKGYKSTWEEWK
jgi:hypothetical protein